MLLLLPSILAPLPLPVLFFFFHFLFFFLFVSSVFRVWFFVSEADEPEEPITGPSAFYFGCNSIEILVSIAANSFALLNVNESR